MNGWGSGAVVVMMILGLRSIGSWYCLTARIQYVRMVSAPIPYISVGASLLGAGMYIKVAGKNGFIYKKNAFNENFFEIKC